jgi:DNA repair protein RadC
MTTRPVNQLTNAQLLHEILSLIHTLPPQDERDKDAPGEKRMQAYLSANEDSIRKAITRPTIASEQHINGRIELPAIKLIAEAARRIKIEEKEAEGKRPEYIRTKDDVVGYVLPDIQDNPDQEHLWVFDLAPDQHLLSHRKLFTGGDDSITLDFKTLFRESIINKAAQMVIVHNHPGQNLTPSEQDLRTKENLKQAARLLDIRVAGFIIVVEDGRCRDVLGSIPA